MAKSLMFFASLGLAASSAIAASGALSDPTRPPPAFIPKEKTASGVDVPPVNDLSGVALQSIMLAPQRKSAIINGETVLLGQDFRGARLVEIKETYVVLLGPQGPRRLEMTPGVRKAQPGSRLGANAYNRTRTIKGDTR